MASRRCFEDVDMTKKLHLESMIMGVVLALIVAGGVFFVIREQAEIPTREVNHNLKRYEEGSLQHVAETLIQYQRESAYKTELEEVWGIALGERGIYVCGKGGMELYSLGGEKLFSVSSDKTMRYIGFNASGELMVCEGNGIAIYDVQGNVLRRLENSSWGLLNAVVQSGDFLYIADRSSRLIWKCDATGKVIATMGGIVDGATHNFVIPGPYMDLSLDPNGNLVTSNPGRHQVNTYTLEGKLQQSFGQPSFKHTGFCGCCNPVALTVLKNGNVVTTEKGISRVKILNPQGEFVGMVAAPIDFRANKHAYVVDLVEGDDGKIYMIDNGTQEILIYKKKDPDHV